MRAADNKSTDFADAQSFSNAGAYQGYTVAVITTTTTNADGSTSQSSTTSCYAAKATASAATDADFTIVMDPSTGIVTKTCSDEDAPGCNDPLTNDGEPSW